MNEDKTKTTGKQHEKDEALVLSLQPDQKSDSAHKTSKTQEEEEKTAQTPFSFFHYFLLFFSTLFSTPDLSFV